MDFIDDYKNEMEIEQVIKKEAKGNKVERVTIALGYTQAKIEEFRQSVADGSGNNFSTKAKIKIYLVYESNLKKRLNELKKRGVRADLAKERYYVRRSFSGNTIVRQSRNSSNSNNSSQITSHDNEALKVVEFLKTGGNLKEFVSTNENQTQELDYTKLLGGPETLVEVPEPNPDEITMEMILEKTQVQTLKDKYSYPRFTIETGKKERKKDQEEKEEN